MSQEAWMLRIEMWREQERDRAGAVAVLLTRSGPALQSLVACWPNLAHSWQPPTDPVPADDRSAWMGMWGQLETLAPEVAGATGLSEREALVALRAAVVNRIIMPDGGLTEGARAWLAAEAGAILSRGLSRAKKG